MKHYLMDGVVFAFEQDGSQDHLITEDMVQLSAEQLAALRAPAPPTPEQVQARFVGLIQQRLDAFAQTRAYDGILSACTYVTSSVPRFAADAAYCVVARDTTWSAGYAILADVQAGVRPVPQSMDDIESELPVLAWPESEE
jgi:hypothetical protein